MTNEEAISRIQNDLQWHSKELTKEYKIALNMAIESLEKQMPKKPIRLEIQGISQYKSGCCPMCGNEIGQVINYCYMCGQKISWEEE